MSADMGLEYIVILLQIANICNNIITNNSFPTNNVAFL